MPGSARVRLAAAVIVSALVVLALVAGAALSLVAAPHVAGGPGSSQREGTLASTSRTYYLAPNGDDAADGSADHPWRTVIRASRALRPGDTLLARGGRYLGQGGYGWTASGTPEAPIIFAAAPGETPIFDGSGAEQWVILDGVHDLRIEGLEITGYRPIRNGVLVVTGDSHDITLEGLVMRGNASGGNPADRLAHLIYPGAGPVTNLTIRGCQLDAAGMGGAAIHVFHDPGPINLVIEDNDLRNGHWGVIVASNADGVTIRGNRFSGNDDDVEIWDEARNVSVGR